MVQAKCFSRLGYFPEEFGEFCLRVLASIVQGEQVFPL
jgi:hypothetical protein